VSWRFIEAPILRDGFLATCRRWRALLGESLRPVYMRVPHGSGTEPDGGPVPASEGAEPSGWPMLASGAAGPSGGRVLADEGAEPDGRRVRDGGAAGLGGKRVGDGGAAGLGSGRVLVGEGLRPADARRRLPVLVAAGALAAVAVAGYGIGWPASAAPAGLLRQVAQGQRVSAASQASPASRAGATPTAPGAYTSPASAADAGPSATPAPVLACGAGGRSPKVSGRRVTAVGDSVMVASAAALQAAMPGIYINAQVGRSMVAGLAIIQSLAASHVLRHYVVVGLGTNGPVSAGQIRQLRHLIGPHRDLILVNTFGPMSWESEVNSVLAAAARDSTQISLANWHRAIAGHTGLLWPDGIHPQPSGAKVYARVVLAAVRADLPHAAASACDQPVSGAR
jgi:hypothetical protein